MCPEPKVKDTSCGLSLYLCTIYNSNSLHLKILKNYPNLTRDQQNNRSQIVKILGFMSQMVYFATTPFYYYSMKSAVDNSRMNECDCVPIKLYL